MDALDLGCMEWAILFKWALLLKVRTRSEQGQINVRTRSKQYQNKVRTISEQGQQVIMLAPVSNVHVLLPITFRTVLIWNMGNEETIFFSFSIHEEPIQYLSGTGFLRDSQNRLLLPVMWKRKLKHRKR
jgi:hypothetical protein